MAAGDEGEDSPTGTGVSARAPVAGRVPRFAAGAPLAEQHAQLPLDVLLGGRPRDVRKRLVEHGQQRAALARHAQQLTLALGFDPEQALRQQQVDDLVPGLLAELEGPGELGAGRLLGPADVAQDAGRRLRVAARPGFTGWYRGHRHDAAGERRRHNQHGDESDERNAAGECPPDGGGARRPAEPLEQPVAESFPWRAADPVLGPVCLGRGGAGLGPLVHGRPGAVAGGVGLVRVAVMALERVMDGAEDVLHRLGALVAAVVHAERPLDAQQRSGLAQQPPEPVVGYAVRVGEGADQLDAG
ncbi:hypothetical protein GCM10023321_73240 [Pseudonocardia eucalypti]|uniref:Uncharacterized protein n=1 Tax=Pseudonocardia eucalypti TaxID=648755 RepID=A0ABP9R7V9_9PSEU